jgi:hypothetical protein
MLERREAALPGNGTIGRMHVQFLVECCSRAMVSPEISSHDEKNNHIICWHIRKVTWFE